MKNHNELMKIQYKLAYKVYTLQSEVKAMNKTGQHIYDLLSKHVDRKNSQISANVERIPIENFKSIETIEQLTDFELKLSNPEFAKKSVSLFIAFPNL